MSPSEKLEDRSSWYRDRAKWIYDDYKKGVDSVTMMLKYGLARQTIMMYVRMYEEYNKRQRKRKTMYRMRSIR